MIISIEKTNKDARLLMRIFDTHPIGISRFDECLMFNFYWFQIVVKSSRYYEVVDKKYFEDAERAYRVLEDQCWNKE